MAKIVPQADKPDSEVVLITFDDIIKTPYIKVLEYLENDYDRMSEVFDIELIPPTRNEKLAWLSLRENDNPLDDLLYPELVDTVDTDEILLAIKYELMENLYTDEDILPMGEHLGVLLAHKSVHEIVLYTDIFDPRIDIELEAFKTEHKKTVRYVSGDFLELFKSNDFTLIILNNIRYLNMLYHENTDFIKYSSIMLTHHAYNYTTGNDEIEINFDGYTYDDLEKIPCRCGLFAPYRLDSETFEDLFLYQENIESSRDYDDDENEGIDGKTSEEILNENEEEYDGDEETFG